ncbi:FHA domain-containing protein [Rhodococcus sp. IEGM 1366]|uniref:NYN domain-containing protein n=1 Tax=Rhodococcus sp. IEGM 1366 TaxID=3082223 RepID=UPI0029531866|nr:FHA domain-containing protein [Rhodococcus sp. IEGM 1366]MDV8065579.1 FHA domain-containing protein [Rhodococcus sp. IEGM 1366]
MITGDKINIFAIDLSNICWDKSLPPLGGRGPLVSRFVDVATALEEQFPGSTMLCVADNSLRHAVSDMRGRKWREIREKYAITEVPVADEIILDYAERNNAVVISRDQFVDHRRQHPWIIDDPARFVKPINNGDKIEFVPSGIKFESHHAISMMIERKELQQLGIDLRGHRAILNTHWRCKNSLCLQSKLWNVLLLWPAVDESGTACCPTCRQALDPLGPRPRARQLIAFSADSDVELFRFPVEFGLPIVLGRGPLRNGISIDALIPNTPEVSRISRQHLVVNLSASDSLEVTDLDSSNGTRICQRPGGDAVVLTPNTPTILDQLATVDIGGAIRIEISGQRFIPDTASKPAGSTQEFPMTPVEPTQRRP